VLMWAAWRPDLFCRGNLGRWCLYVGICFFAKERNIGVTQ